MGRHSKVEPKKVSFLGSVGGIFAAMALTGGIFAISQLAGDSPVAKPAPVEQPPSDTQVLPETLVVSRSANLPGPTEVPSIVPVDTGTVIPVPGTQVPTQPPTLNPSPNPSPARPAVDVDIQARTPAGSLDTDVEVHVPLLGEVVDTVDDTVTGIISLLDK